MRGRGRGEVDGLDGEDVGGGDVDGGADCAVGSSAYAGASVPSVFHRFFHDKIECIEYNVMYKGYSYIYIERWINGGFILSLSTKLSVRDSVNSFGGL